MRPSPVKRPTGPRRPLRAAATAAAGSLLLAGCYQGFGTTVNDQPPTGNGTYFTVPAQDGPIWVQNTTIIAAPDGKSGALSFTMVNNTDQVEQLVAVQTDPATKVSQTAPIEIKPKAAVQVGGPSGVPIKLTDLTVPAGSYANVVLSFRVAGVSQPQQVLVVPPAGYYASYAPSPDPTPTPTPKPKASKSASPKATKKK